jgi:hypothetical protein
MAGHCRSFRSFSCSETGVVFVAGFSASAAVAAGARPVDQRPATAAAATWGFFVRSWGEAAMFCSIRAFPVLTDIVDKVAAVFLKAL